MDSTCRKDMGHQISVDPAQHRCMAVVSALAFLNARAIWLPPDAPECPGESNDGHGHPQNHRHKLNSSHHPIPRIQIAETIRDNHSYVKKPCKCPGERQGGKNHSHVKVIRLFPIMGIPQRWQRFNGPNGLIRCSQDNPLLTPDRP